MGYDSSIGRYGFRNLSGEIRPSLMNLGSLGHLDLSFNTFNGIPIPDFFGSLENLPYLNLSNASFSGTIPPNLGNLSHLEVVYLNCTFEYEWALHVENLQWIIGLISLEHLSMNGVNLSLVTHWVGALNQLSSIIESQLLFCGLSGCVPSLVSLNFTSLAVIDLSTNGFETEILDWLVILSSFQHIDLRDNSIEGGIPSSIGKLCNLKYFDLSKNNMIGSLSEFLKGIESCPYRNPLPILEKLDLRSNHLVGKIPNWLGQLESLVDLDLSDNMFEGSIPTSLGSSQNLMFLDLSQNKLNGTLPDSLGQFSALSSFYAFYNQSTGIVFDAHFSKLTKLDFDLSRNSLIVNVSSNWMPSFQLMALAMGSCIVEPSFPTWLKSQKELKFLD